MSSWVGLSVAIPVIHGPSPTPISSPSAVLGTSSFFRTSSDMLYSPALQQALYSFSVMGSPTNSCWLSTPFARDFSKFGRSVATAGLLGWAGVSASFRGLIVLNCRARHVLLWSSRKLRGVRQASGNWRRLRARSLAGSLELEQAIEGRIVWFQIGRETVSEVLSICFHE